MKRLMLLVTVLSLGLLASPVHASSNVSIGIYLPGVNIQFGTPGPSDAYYDGPYVMVGIGVPLYYYGGAFFYLEGGTYHYYGRCARNNYNYYNSHWQQHYAYHQRYPNQYGPPTHPTHPRPEWHPDQKHFQQYPHGRQIQSRAPYQGPMRGKGWNQPPQQRQGHPSQGYQGQGRGGPEQGGQGRSSGGGGRQQ
jgi:hypothetical protein